MMQALRLCVGFKCLLSFQRQSPIPQCLCVYVYIYIYICTCVYIYRERERDRYIDVYREREREIIIIIIITIIRWFASFARRGGADDAAKQLSLESHEQKTCFRESEPHPGFLKSSVV